MENGPVRQETLETAIQAAGSPGIEARTLSQVENLFSNLFRICSLVENMPVKKLSKELLKNLLLLMLPSIVCIRLVPIMLLKLPIMLWSNAPEFYLLCSNYAP